MIGVSELLCRAGGEFEAFRSRRGAFPEFAAKNFPGTVGSQSKEEEHPRAIGERSARYPRARKS
jgi:hypothetical protein